MSSNTSAEVSIPSLVTSEDFHGQSFTSVVTINKTWCQRNKQVTKHAGVNLKKKRLMTDNTSAEMRIPFLVTQEECHGQSFSSVVIIKHDAKEINKL